MELLLGFVIEKNKPSVIHDVYIMAFSSSMMKDSEAIWRRHMTFYSDSPETVNIASQPVT
jgi:hypothetical protein